MLSLKRSFVTFVVCLSTVAASAEESGPGVSAVRRAQESVAASLQKKVAPGSEAEKQLANEISMQLRGFLDVDELGRRALVDHWGKLKEPQRRQFLAVLRGLVEANYVRALRSNLQYQVSYLREEPKEDARRVLTEIRMLRKGREEVISVDYLLRKDGDAWRAFDVVTDGVGLIENYRAQFNRILDKEGFPALIDRMKKKQAQLDAAQATPS
jgi:phospholipid transport system substrate-binding protein